MKLPVPTAASGIGTSMVQAARTGARSAKRKGQFGFDTFLDIGIIIVALVMLAGVGAYSLDWFGEIANSSDVTTIVNTGIDSLDQLASVTGLMVVIGLLLLVVGVFSVLRNRGGGSAV